MYKKLSYCRESAHLTSLYRTVQKVWITSVTDRPMDGLLLSIEIRVLYETHIVLVSPLDQIKSIE